jgi:hypothetical protein
MQIQVSFILIHGAFLSDNLSISAWEAIRVRFDKTLNVSLIKWRVSLGSRFSRVMILCLHKMAQC